MKINIQSVLSKVLIFAIIFLLSLSSNAQDKKNYRVGVIGFYNLENLFDTENDTLKNDEEFLPDGKNTWTDDRYAEKLSNMAEVIRQIGSDVNPDGPAILGVSEIENRRVLEDLIKTAPLDSQAWDIVHYDSPDRRGVDVGMIYQPKYFTVYNSASYLLTLEGDPGFKSRDQLVVSGVFDGDTIHVIVNHWPSRWGGEKASRHKRIAAASLNRKIVDSILMISPDAKIIVMGDLNDNPTDPSVKKYLKSGKNPKKLSEGELYNPMVDLYKMGIGSNAWRDSWNLFDQVIVSQGFLDAPDESYKYYKAMVFNKNFLTQSSGKYKGYPYRTYGGGAYMGGYSDHFPVYILIYKEVK